MESIMLLLSRNAIDTVSLDFGLPYLHQHAAEQTQALQAVCTTVYVHANPLTLRQTEKIHLHLDPNP